MLEAIICSKELEKQNQEINIPISFPLLKDLMETAFESVGIKSVEDCKIVDASANIPIISKLMGKLDLNQNSLFELDYFNQQLDSLDEFNLTRYLAAVDLNKPTTLKDAINLTANSDQIYVISEVSSLQELGEFLYDNDMIEMNPRHTGKTTADGFGIFDFTEIAVEHLTQNNAQISHLGFIEDSRMANEYIQIYDGTTLPNDYELFQEQNGPSMNM